MAYSSKKLRLGNAIVTTTSADEETKLLAKGWVPEASYVPPSTPGATAPVDAATLAAKADAIGPWGDIVRAAQFGYSHTAAVFGDSTSDNLGANEWPLLALKLLSEKYGSVRMEHYQWNDATQVYGAATVVNAGAAAAGGVIAHDTFSVDGNAVGAAADTKGTWVGNGTATKSGGRASLIAGNTAAISILTPMQDSTVTSKLIVTTAGLTGFNAFRFANAMSNASLTGFGLHMTLSHNGQWVTHLSLHKTVDGTGVKTISTETIDLGLGNVTSKPVTIETKLVGLTFTGTITVEGRAPVVRTFNITAEEKAAIGSYAGSSVNPGNLGGGHVYDEVKVETAVIPTPTIKVYNGSVAGKNPDYLRAAGRLAKLLPVPVDSAMLSFGHNSHLNPGGPDDFITDYKTTLDLLRTAQPSARIFIGSQNPEFTPRDASLIIQHAAKQSRLAKFARDNGCRYVPVYEAFANAAADNGRSLVQADGVHPTNPASLVTSGSFGSTFWARQVTGL